jgi:hypothetical protein
MGLLMDKVASPKDGAARQAKYRQEQAKLGRRPRLVYLTDAEKAEFDRWLLATRKGETCT